MAENNRNRSDLHDQDWDRNRNRNSRDEQNRNIDREDNYNYRNTGSSYGSGYSSNAGNQYGGYSSNYGNRNQGDQQWQNTGSQGNQYSEGNDWYRRQQGNRYDENWGRDQNAGNMGNDYHSGNWGSGRRENTGNYEDNRNRDFRNDNRDRGWWDKTKDEVSSWFDDDDAERRRRMDKMSGPHKGKGPKDYRRSEDRIREDVCDRLSDDDMLDATNINVQIQGNEVVLTGTVETRDQKRRAEDLVERVSGVSNVENRIRVTRGDNFDMRNYTGTTDEVGGIGNESGTTSEIIRDVRNDKR